MKQIYIYGFFLGFFFMAFSINAQENTLDCNDNLQKALNATTVAKDSLKAIEYSQPCLDAKNPNAQLIMGHLHLNSSDEKDIEKGFQLIKKAAKQKHSVAIENLGVLYKYGRGCKLNYNKARRWFKKGAKLGNHKAAYSLGYLYLKGLGNTKQNYKKAVQWFEKSEYPMAKYWLGVCFLKGYGVVKDIAKANTLLGTDFEQAQTTITAQKQTIKTATETNNTTEYLKENSASIQEKNLYGKWTGQLLQMDWSGTVIENNIPLNIIFTKDKNDNIKYTWKVKGKELLGNSLYIDEALYFENLQITLPHTSYHKGEPNKLSYQILSSELSLKNIAETTYLTGTLESYIPTWNEPSIPMRFVLAKEKAMTTNNIEISDAILDALATQKDSFIKLYPNPFISDLIIAYSLNETSDIQIELKSIEGTKNYTIEQGKQQVAGDYRYHFEGGKLPKGLYVVNIFVNGIKKTKLIVKK